MKYLGGVTDRELGNLVKLTYTTDGELSGLVHLFIHSKSWSEINEQSHYYLV